MEPNPPGGIQFLFYQSGATSAEDQRRAHSYAARAAHAKAKRLCTLEYQARKDGQLQEKAHKVKEQSIVLRNGMQLNRNKREPETPVVPSVWDPLAAYQGDPFMSFARPFKPLENLLLDHCKTTQ